MSIIAYVGNEKKYSIDEKWKRTDNKCVTYKTIVLCWTGNNRALEKYYESLMWTVYIVYMYVEVILDSGV